MRHDPASAAIVIMLRSLKMHGMSQAVTEPFCGSGSCLIAAETTGRICHAVELDPAYVDVTVLRWQALTGQVAVLDGDGLSFSAVQAARATTQEAS